MADFFGCVGEYGVGEISGRFHVVARKLGRARAIRVGLFGKSVGPLDRLVPKPAPTLAP